jgi:hypothetical protein
VRVNSKKPSGASKSVVLALDMDELNDIIARAASALPEEDCAKLRASMETFAWMQQELTKKNVDLARLRVPALCEVGARRVFPPSFRGMKGHPIT